MIDPYFQLTDAIRGEDEDDTAQLNIMFQEARSYIEAFRWCEPVERSYLALGVGGVFALFLFIFKKAIAGTDKELWVVSGDVPSAYFVVDDARTVPDAIDTYCSLMEDWVVSVEQDDDDEEIFPVAAPRTKANAEDLKTRMAFIRENFL